MIQVTDQAMDMLDQIDRPQGRVLRLEPTGVDKLGLVLGEALEDDTVVERRGHDTLHIPASVSVMLTGAVIDRVETEQGPGFGISQAPHAEADGS